MDALMRAAQREGIKATEDLPEPERKIMRAIFACGADVRSGEKKGFDAFLGDVGTAGAKRISRVVREHYEFTEEMWKGVGALDLFVMGVRCGRHMVAAEASGEAEIVDVSDAEANTKAGETPTRPHGLDALFEAFGIGGARA